MYLNFARLQLAFLLGVALVLGKQPGTPVFALHKAFKRRALICEHGNHLPVISLLSAFNEDEIAIIDANVDHRITRGSKQVTIAVNPFLGNGNVALYILSVIFRRTTRNATANHKTTKGNLHSILPSNGKRVLAVVLDNATVSKGGQIAIANGVAHLHILKDVLELGRLAVVLSYVAVNELRHLIQFFFIHPLHKRLTNFNQS